MSSDDCQSKAPPSGLLLSALSSLQGRFAAAAAGTPGGGVAAPRGESFVSSVSSVLGGSYVLPGGLGGRGGLVIVKLVDLPSVGGSTPYEVVAGLRTKSSCQCQRWKARGDTPRPQGLGAMES